MCCVASHEHPTPPRAASALPACETAGVVPQELVLRLQLRNTDNHCYMNSLIIAMLWVATHPVGTQVELFRGLLTSVKPLLQGSAFALMDLFMWRMFVQAWPNPSLQHDVPEFAMYLMRKAASRAYEGFWCAWDPGAPRSLIAPLLHQGLGFRVPGFGLRTKVRPKQKKKYFPRANQEGPKP